MEETGEKCTIATVKMGLGPGEREKYGTRITR
jgi:hypothetical protein